MLFLTKEKFKEKVLKQANDKINHKNRRRRLDGRLELLTFEILEPFLPDIVEYCTTAKNNIRSDYFALNIKKPNVHIFNNNTAYILNDKKYKWTYYIVVKATFQGVVKVDTTKVLHERITLHDIMEMLANGTAERCDTLTL